MHASYTSTYFRIDLRNRLTFRRTEVIILLPTGVGSLCVINGVRQTETAKYRLRSRYCQYVNVHVQAQKGYVTFQFMCTKYFPAVHGIVAIVTRRSSHTSRTSGSRHYIHVVK